MKEGRHTNEDINKTCVFIRLTPCSLHYTWIHSVNMANTVKQEKSHMLNDMVEILSGLNF